MSFLIYTDPHNNKKITYFNLNHIVSIIINNNCENTLVYTEFEEGIKSVDCSIETDEKYKEVIAIFENQTEDIKEHYLNLLKKEQTFNNFSYKMIIRKFWIDYHNVPREKKLLEAKQLSKSIVITDTNNITHKLQFKNEKHFQDFFITLSTEINK